ncbi:MAG: glycosyltransferase family 2 protein [Thermodesulfobacteriota bacterium]|nr:glycosyltransferase family 2 protein [Thermodesulfobacteriota bacterium]
MSKTRVSIIIPAYNESKTIGSLVREIRNLYYGFEIIVVNDGSSDDTGRIAKEAGAIVYSHPYNIGNGAAVKSGIRIASGDILVFMDGDGQHKPEDIDKLLDQFPEFDMTVGARQKGKQASLGRSLANKIYNRLASYVAKFPIKDLTSGFRAIKADVARNYLYLLPNTYSYPTTLTLCVLRSGKSVKYIPIENHARKSGKSNIRTFRDGIKFVLVIIKICTLYSPLRVFLPTSLCMFVLGLVYYIYTYFTAGRFTNMSALLLTTSVMIFMMGLIAEQISQMRFERSEGDKFV